MEASEAQSLSRATSLATSWASALSKLHAAGAAPGMPPHCRAALGWVRLKTSAGRACMQSKHAPGIDGQMRWLGTCGTGGQWPRLCSRRDAAGLARAHQRPARRATAGGWAPAHGRSQQQRRAGCRRQQHRQPQQVPPQLPLLRQPAHAGRLLSHAHLAAARRHGLRPCQSGAASVEAVARSRERPPVLTALLGCRTLPGGQQHSRRASQPTVQEAVLGWQLGSWPGQAGAGAPSSPGLSAGSPAPSLAPGPSATARSLGQPPLQGPVRGSAGTLSLTPPPGSSQAAEAAPAAADDEWRIGAVVPDQRQPQEPQPAWQLGSQALADASDWRISSAAQPPPAQQQDDNEDCMSVHARTQDKDSTLAATRRLSHRRRAPAPMCAHGHWAELQGWLLSAAGHPGRRCAAGA